MSIGLDIFEKLKELLESLKHAPYNLEDYMDLDEEEKMKRKGNLSILMTVMLLKRLESSSHAFEKTIKWFNTYLAFFREMVLTHGKVMRSATFRRFKCSCSA